MILGVFNGWHLSALLNQQAIIVRDDNTMTVDGKYGAGLVKHSTVSVAWHIKLAVVVAVALRCHSYNVYKWLVNVRD